MTEKYDTTMSRALIDAQIITHADIRVKEEREAKLMVVLKKKKLQKIAESYSELSEGEKVKSEKSPGEK